jgi:DNA-binding LytR/AlgR family response regulator
LKIAICEDNVADCATLSGYIQSYLSKLGCKGEIIHFSSSEKLLSVFVPGEYQIIFLDIYLPGISGMDAARKIRQSDPDCALIFITVSPDFALQGFNVQATGYVMKPIQQNKMDKAMYMCREMLKRASRTIEVPAGREYVSIPAINIRYVEVYQKTTHFYTCGGEITSSLTLDEAEAMLGGEPFLRCHRSYLVNMNHVESIGEQDFCMTCGAMVPIRKNGKKDMRLALTRFKATNSTGAVSI